MKAIKLQPFAKADLADADAWYEAQSPGLGDELLDEFRRTAQMISENPSMYPETEEGREKPGFAVFRISSSIWTSRNPSRSSRLSTRTATHESGQTD